MSLNIPLLSTGALQYKHYHCLIICPFYHSSSGNDNRGLNKSPRVGVFFWPQFSGSGAIHLHTELNTIVLLNTSSC